MVGDWALGFSILELGFWVGLLVYRAGVIFGAKEKAFLSDDGAEIGEEFDCPSEGSSPADGDLARGVNLASCGWWR